MTIIVKELRDALVEAGATYEKADAAAAAVIAIEHAATKQDIVELRADIAELRAATKVDVAELRSATKADIAGVKADIADLRSELYRALWLQAAGIVGVLSAVGALLKVLG